MTTLYRLEPDEAGGGQRLHLSLHAAQLEAWEAAERFIFMIIGTQGGKTALGPWWLYREIATAGAGDYLAVSAAFDLFKLKMLPEMRRVFEDILGVARYWSSTKTFELADPATGSFNARRVDDRMWGRIILRSAQSPAGLESASAKAAWLDECGHPDFDLHAWDAVRRRLSLSRGRVLGTTTPYDLGWLKTEIVDRAARGDKDIRVIHAPSTVNPAFSQEEFEDARRRMQAWRFAMFYEGRMAKPPSLIYGVFNDTYREQGGHLVEPFEIPPHWPRYAGIDFGPDNTAVLYVAHDPRSGVCYAYDESLEGGMTSTQHAKKLLGLVDGTNFQLAMGGAPGEKQYRMDWGAAGVPVQRPMVVDVESGIDSVIGLFQTRRLFVFDSLRVLRAQLGSYSREVDKHGEVTAKIADKAKGHMVDAARYIAPWLSHLGPTEEDREAA